ncbi:MAG: hypothetical protein II339_02605, partial [Spirochaetales bacterium]|nr:hypothetical protein [Spirochaetales bacterium]
MTDSKYDISKGKELYKAVTSLSNLDRTEEDFLGKLHDQEYAKKVYNTFKEDNLLGAKDEKSFLDSLGFNKSSEPAKVEQSVPQKDSSSFFGVQMPNIDDLLSVEIPQVAPVVPKVPDMTMKVLENPFGQTKKLGEMRMADFVGETPEQRLMAQINTLGTDAISDAAKAETIKAEIEKQLRDIDANNADFLKEYTTKLQEAGVNDTNLHHDSWSPIMPWNYKKRKEDGKYLDDHAAYYNSLMEKKKQLQRQYDLVNTFSKYANYGRQLGVQKQLSSMVSNGDLPAYAMETLTSAKSEEERDAYLKSLYDSNEIDKDTMKDIYN